MKFPPQPRSTWLTTTTERSAHSDPDAKAVPGAIITIGFHRIVLLDPGDLPDYLRQNASILSGLAQRIIPPNARDSSAMQAAAEQVLFSMGADREDIARVSVGLPHDKLCMLFCGEDAPILIGHGDDCAVDFVVRSAVDTEDVIAIADALERCALPAQGASLLVAMCTSLNAGSDKQALVLKALACALERHHHDVPLKAAILFQLRTLATGLHDKGKLSNECLHTFRNHEACPAERLASRQIALKKLNPQRVMIEQGLEKLTGEVMERAKVLGPIVNQLLSLHHGAFDAQLAGMLNVAVDTLTSLGDRYADPNALQALGTCHAYRALANTAASRDEASQALDAARNAIGSQLPRLVVIKGGGIRIDDKDKFVPVKPALLLAYLRALADHHGEHPGAIAAYVEHAQRIRQPFAPADVRDLWIRYAYSTPENACDAVRAWLATVVRPLVGAEPSTKELESIVQTCRSASLPASLLDDAMTIVMHSPHAGGLCVLDQAAVLRCLLKLDGQALRKLAETFALMFIPAPKAGMLHPLGGMLDTIVACAGGSFDSALGAVDKAVQFDNELGEPLLFVELVAAMVVRLMKLGSSDQQVGVLTGILERLAFGSLPDGARGYLWMTDVFVALSKTDEGCKALERLLQALLERTKLEALVLVGPKPRHAAYMLLAAFLVARGMATGNVSEELAPHEPMPICSVYFLLALCGLSRRHGRSQAADDFLLEAVDRFLDPPGVREGGWKSWSRAAAAVPASPTTGAIIEACNLHEYGSGYLAYDYLFDPDGLLFREFRRAREVTSLKNEWLSHLGDLHDALLGKST